VTESTRSTLAIREVGTGPVAVLLHAFPCDGRMWLPQAEALAQAGWRCLVVDLPGFGRSQPLPGPPSVEAVAERIVVELALLGVDRCALAGVSLGGYVAMAVVRAHPEIVAALALCDTKASADSDTALANRERLASAVDEDPANVGRILEQAVLPGLLGRTTFAERPEVVQQVRSWLHEAAPTSVAWYQRAMAHRPDSHDALAQAGLPTLVVRGEQDVLSTHEDALAMVAASPDARLVTVPGAGHLAGVEDPAAVSEALTGFLGLVTGPQTS